MRRSDRAAGPCIRCGERVVDQHDQRDDQQAGEGEERVREQQGSECEQGQEQGPDRERDRDIDVDRGLHVGLHMREQLPGRRRAMEVERQLAVSVRDGTTQPGRRRGARDAAVVPAHHDRDRAAERETEEDCHAEPHRRCGYAGAERRSQHAVGHLPERNAHRDGCDGEGERTQERQRERLGMRTDVGAYEPNTSDEHRRPVVMLRLSAGHASSPRRPSSADPRRTPGPRPDV